jgi:hypothetical protein
MDDPCASDRSSLPAERDDGLIDIKLNGSFATQRAV